MGSVDPDLFDRVVWNLLGNAVKFSPAGAEVRVRLEPAGSEVLFQVEDRGPGIPGDQLERVFERFFRTDGVRTTNDSNGGTGLGLASAYGIVKNHGGIIDVHSRKGAGTSFNVFFPATETPVKEDGAEAMEDTIQRGQETILLVDDEKTLADLGRQMLERLGYSVESRTSSIEALEMFKTRSNEFDLVITDMTMPEMTGEMLANELMKIRPHIPIILSTGFSKQMDEEKATQMGIKAFIMKPLVMKNLAHTVREVLDEK